MDNIYALDLANAIEEFIEAIILDKREEEEVLTQLLGSSEVSKKHRTEAKDYLILTLQTRIPE